MPSSRQRPDPNATPMQGTNRTQALGADEIIQTPQVRKPSAADQALAGVFQALRTARLHITGGFRALRQRIGATRTLRAITADELLALFAIIAGIGVLLSVLLVWRLAECRTASAAAGVQETLAECLIPGR